MTMPHLMNCEHSEDGWCLDCVKTMHDRAELAEARVELLSTLTRQAAWNLTDLSGNIRKRLYAASKMSTPAEIESVADEFRYPLYTE